MKPVIENDPNKSIIIAIENSLNTGFNFQMANRLIRVESVWTSGDLEQAESRINRPDPDNLDPESRSDINFDWILVNETVDVTKMARLIARLVHTQKFSAVGSKYELDYKNIPNIPLLSLSPSMIAAACGYEDQQFVSS